MALKTGGRHRRPWQLDPWPVWTGGACLWGWLTYEVAVMDWPAAVVGATAATAGVAFGAGYYIATR